MTTVEIRDLVERLGFDMFGPAFPDVTVEADMVAMEQWTIRRDDDRKPPAWVLDRAEPYGGGQHEPPGVDVVEVSRSWTPTQAIARLMAEYANSLAMGITQAWAEAEAPDEIPF